MVLAAMRTRWEALFRGAVEDDELDRVLRYLETPLTPEDGKVVGAQGRRGGNGTSPSSPGTH